jgi:TetR/AcrR family transcriptional regulator, mexJK operon transcriptional repressor
MKYTNMAKRTLVQKSAIASPGMPAQRKRRGPGRPRDPAKLEAILDAAYELFLERGIAATTMDSVAERASVSKMTVYANFRDKPALLAAVFEHRVKMMHVPDLPVGSDLSVALERLVEFGELIVSACTQPDVVRMARLMVEAAEEHPRLAATYYTAGRGKMVKRIAVFFESLTERGVLSIEDPELAAEQLMASWGGLCELRQSLGVAAPPSRDEVTKRVRYAIDTMVRAWSTGAVADGRGRARFKRAPLRRRARGA